MARSSRGKRSKTLKRSSHVTSAKNAKKIVRHAGHRHPTKDLSDDQEFQLMKMVLDKFLWLGTGLIGVGLFFMLTNADIYSGVPYAAAGIGIMIVFGLTIVRYFENYSS